MEKLDKRVGRLEVKVMQISILSRKAESNRKASKSPLNSSFREFKQIIHKSKG